MSLATKICANAFNFGLRSLNGCGYVIQTIASRNFHQMMRPVAAPFMVPLATSPLTPAVPTVSKLLQPFNVIVNQVAGFKVKGRLRRRCKDCYFVIRNQRHYVICPTHRRHKQMSMKKSDYNTWILTHATQSKIRPY